MHLSQKPTALYTDAHMFFLGISLENQGFRVAILKKEKGERTLEATHFFSYDEEGIKNFYNLPLIATKKQITLTSCLQASDLFVRKLHLPLHSKQQIAKVLPFQLETLLPNHKENAVTCTLIRYSKPMTTVTILSSTKEKLTAHLNELKQIEIIPDQVSSAQSALFRFARWQFPSEKTLICLDVRDEKLTCVALYNDEIILSQTLDKEPLSSQLETLHFFLKQKGLLEGKTSFLCTGNESLEALESHLSSWTEIALLTTSHAKEALCIGLAMEGSSADAFNVQFCQQELLPEPIFKKKKKQLLIYALSCLVATLIASLSGTLLINTKEKEICQTLKQHLPHIETNLSAEQIEHTLIEWENSVKGKKNSLYLIPSVPKVSEVLAYLSTHPALVTELGEHKEGVDIQSIHYQLTKFPKIGNLNATYLAQLDLDLKSDTPRIARDFHEALIKSDPMVNGKKEIKWYTNHPNYHACFELSKKGGGK